MKIAIGSYGQETSSFSQLATTIDSFKTYGLFQGEEILEKCREVGSIGGFLETVDTKIPGWAPEPIIHGWAGASGPMTAQALDYFESALCDGLQDALPLDGIYLALHGAAAADNEPDTEGHLLAAVRKVVGDKVPLVISLDHHANLTARMVDNVNALVAHRDQPHDQRETGVLAGRILVDVLSGDVRPTMAWRKIPIITHQEQFLTSRGPMKEWFDLARDMESRPGVVSASTFPMQPWLDVPEGGWAAIVITNDDPSLADKLSAELANEAWRLREAFCRLDSILPDEAIRKALEADRGLVVLTDTGDSVFGGATGDSTCILEEMVRQKIDQPALFPTVDPVAVEKAITAGEGKALNLSLGGKLDPVFGRPFEVEGRVARIGGGRIDLTMLGFESVDLGRAVLLEVGAVKVVVTEKRGICGNHPAVYEHFGIDVGNAKMVVVKTASNWQFYNEWLSEVIRVDTPGATMSHLEQFSWAHLPRPIYPLDDQADWQA